MPRLNRIRITGNKYDGFQKRHRDSIFDLASDHTLFTLQNGSGKGVMLQLISQIMLPGTSWGSNNGNKVEGMFYDRYGVFKPYTFHVVLEWSLDGNEQGRLLAGICVTARRKQSLDESEDKVGLRYFLYTHKYSGDSRFALEKLPLYSSQKDSPLDYEGMQSFVEENNRDFRKYSMSSVTSLNSDYYQYLASHGIYRSEWEIMKTINRSEGGLEKYFSRAKDNQALFDKLIIPAVSESISSRSEENEDSLLNMFIDNIKIAENLPELISRTEDINHLLTMVEPLLLDAEHGNKLKDSKKRIRHRGNNYFHALQNRKTYLKNELEKSKIEQENTEEKIEELKYEEYNLKYAYRMREKDELKEKSSNLAQDISFLEEKHTELSQEKKKLELNRLYLSYREYKNELEKNKERINELESSAAIAEIREELKKIKEKIKKDWPELKRKWEESSSAFIGYKKYLVGRRKQLLQQEENLKERIHQREREVDRYNEQKKKLQDWKEELASRFNPLQLASPSYLADQLSTDLKEEKGKLQELQNRKEKLEIEIEARKENKNKKEIKLARLDSDYQGLEEKYKQRKEKEEKVFATLLNLLDLDKGREVYSSEWLKEKKLKVENLLEEKKEKLQDLNNRFYELELDLNLNDNDYWIANHDQKQLYQAIRALDISVQYGSKFLMDLAERKEKLLRNYPLLPYGLVVMYEEDWKKVKGNLADSDIFRAPVPIFINHKLDGKNMGEALRLVQGRELDFITDPQIFADWYSGLDREQKEINQTIDTLEQKTKNINQSLFTADELLRQKPAEGLKGEMSELNSQIEELKENISIDEKNIKRLTENKQKLIQRITDKEDKLTRLKEDYQEIKKFARKSTEIAGQKEEIEEIKGIITELKSKLKDTENDLHHNMKLKMEVENDYNNWLKDLEKFLAELKEIVPEIEYNEPETGEEQPNYPQFYDYRDSRANYHYQQLMDLEKKEEEKNTELKYLRRERERLQKEILEIKTDMKALDADWESYSFSLLTRVEVKHKLEAIAGEIEQLVEKLEGKREEYNIINGELKAKKSEINELYAEIKERFQKTARSWLDIDLNTKELEIKDGLEENRNYIRKLKEMIADYNDKIMQVNTLINKLEYYRLDAEKGDSNTHIREEIRLHPQDLIEKWEKDYQEIEEKLKNLKEKTENDYYQFKRNVNELLTNEILKTKINEKIIQDFHSEDYSYNLEVLTSFREYLHSELNQLDDDKSEAERARTQWAERSAMHVIRIITSLQEMINNMVYHNNRGHAFPLVRLRRKDILPENEEEIIPELKEYFIEIIEKFKRDDINIERLTESQLKEYTGDAALFSRTVRGRYPVLQVYKMTEKNEFLYARPRDYYYADWESVIQGKGDTPEGSGGQSLSINAFMMMMLLNYKKQRFDRSNPWTVLFLDNPFGKASAAHVLDPVFKIADKLNFQIVAFAAPEIIKTEISERFPVFWALEINSNDKGQGIVNGQVIYGERVRRT